MDGAKVIGECECGGEIERWWFGADCSGDPGSQGVNCKECGKDYKKETQGGRIKVRARERDGQ